MGTLSVANCIIILFATYSSTAYSTSPSIAEPSHHSFEAFLFAKMHPTDIINASVQVQHHMNWSQCISPPNYSHPIVYVLLGELPCMPHHIIMLQSSCGFDAILLVHSSKLVSFYRTSMWSSHHLMIPMYHTTDSSIDWHSVQNLTLVHSDQPVYFSSNAFLVQAIMMGLINSGAALLKLSAVAQRLYGYNRAERASNLPLAILILESMTSVCVIIYSIDPFGVFGIYPFSFTVILVGIILNASFLTTCFCWYIFVLIEQSVVKKHKCSVSTLFSIILILYTLVNAGVLALISMGHIFNGVLEAIGIFDAITQIMVGISFLRVKTRLSSYIIRNESKESSGSKQSENSRRNLILGKCGLIILFYVVISIFTEAAFFITNSLTAWYGIYLSLLSLTIIGYYQVSSIQYTNSYDHSSTSKFVQTRKLKK